MLRADSSRLENLRGKSTRECKFFFQKNMDGSWRMSVGLKWKRFGHVYVL